MILFIGEKIPSDVAVHRDVRVLVHPREVVAAVPAHVDLDGDIEPGYDHPLDLGGSRQIVGGEVKYPEGLESKS